ncbi:TetR/AcrR family transcriptional regulator [Streptomyces sp. NPDC087659]|uniref:TetR/AcrR family transcriptional regulator n=1 Tax=Streptomyces sp. NPDC087659 TaxID=3365801 RepID=UPI0038066BA5
MHNKATMRQRIVAAAAALLAEGGREAVSTRSVSKAAGIQPPTIYRQFGDMQGLLDAVAADGFEEYLQKKARRERASDPVEDLRRGWDLHVDFGVAHPEIYKIMFGQPRLGAEREAVARSFVILRGLVQRVAEAGRLTVSVERAVHVIHAAACGVVLTLVATPPGQRDAGLSSCTREAVLAAVSTAATDGDTEEPPSAVARAVAFKAMLPDLADSLTPGERALLTEWLDRITRAA